MRNLKGICFRPSKNLLVFKTTWRRLKDMSWRRFQNVFSVTIFRFPRRLEDVLKASWKRKNCYAEGVLKICLQNVLTTCLQNVFKPSWRQTKCLLGISHLYLKNLNLCLINLRLTYLYLTNQGESKMHLVPNNYDIHLIWELKQHFYFKN